MNTTTLTSKNQVTLPAKLVRQAGFSKGMILSSRIEKNAIILEPKPDIRTAAHAAQQSLKPYVKEPLSDSQIHRILQEWS